MSIKLIAADLPFDQQHLVFPRESAYAVHAKPECRRLCLSNLHLMMPPVRDDLINALNISSTHAYLQPSSSEMPYVMRFTARLTWEGYMVQLEIAVATEWAPLLGTIKVKKHAVDVVSIAAAASPYLGVSMGQGIGAAIRAHMQSETTFVSYQVTMESFEEEPEREEATA